MAIGVDVERTDRIVEFEMLAARFFSASETAALARIRTDPRTRFYDLWTLKEAFIKATGKGLSQPLSSFGFDLDADAHSIRFAAPAGMDAAEWHFALYAPLPAARLAVAAHASHPGVVRWRAYDARALDAGAAPILPMLPIRTSAG
jgi:4'-phosphopantetheinyl transferase